MAYGLSNGHVTDDVTWPPKVLWGSTVGYPSDSSGFLLFDRYAYDSQFLNECCYVCMLYAQNGFTALYMAAQENHVDVVRCLLLHSANQTLATEARLVYSTLSSSTCFLHSLLGFLPYYPSNSLSYLLSMPTHSARYSSLPDVMLYKSTHYLLTYLLTYLT